MSPTIVVPIKSHSQRLKDKNFISLGGTPLYRWTFDSLTETDAPVVVACNNPEIRKEAEDYGFAAIDRPPEWDVGSAWDVALHATDAEHVGLCLVTCPFRRKQDVNRAVERYQRSHAIKPVLSAVKVNHRSILHQSGHATIVRGLGGVGAHVTTGVIQVAKRSMVKDGYVERDGAIVYTVPSIVGLDIDTPLDWCAAFGYVETKRKEKLMEGAA